MNAIITVLLLVSAAMIITLFRLGAAIWISLALTALCVGNILVSALLWICSRAGTAIKVFILISALVIISSFIVIICL